MHDDLMEQVAAEENLRRALGAVKRNRGAAGIDGMTTDQLESHFQRHGEKIRAKLVAGRWTPSPVRRVEIPKPHGGQRLLGIPTVMDRLLQQALLQVLTPIFEPMFSESSYGFRPGRSAHDAVRAAQEYVREGQDWVVDIDIAKFFDHVNHDILMRRIAQVIRDKRILRLIGRYLRAGVLLNGVLVKSEEGTPQGGPLSPLLANIYLDALDRELENRELSFCRYADDCNIYVGSEAAAKRVLAGIGNWIEQHLRLQVNEAKSGAGRPWERKFLGFRINRRGQREVAPQSVERFQQKVREIWRSCRSVTSRELRDEWRRYVIGWWGYYRLAEERRAVFRLEGWIRRHIRKCFWLRWHSVRGRCRALRCLGVPEWMLRYVPTRRGAWFVAARAMMHTALSKRNLQRLRIRDAIGSRGKQVSRRVQPPDTENRTSGGVGGCRGAIPGTRRDRRAGAAPIGACASGASLIGAARVPVPADPKPSAGDDHNAESNAKLSRPRNGRVGPVIYVLTSFF